MKGTHRILIATAQSADEQRIRHELQKLHLQFIFRIADTETSFVHALHVFMPDVIISDCQLPLFDATSVLKLTLQLSPVTPVIIITEPTDEDAAVECLKAGAIDYIIKDYLKKLGPAVIKALEQRKIRLEKIRAEESLQRNEMMYQLMFANNPQPMLIYDIKTLRILEVNEAATNLYGYTKSEFLALTIKAIRPPDDIPELLRFLNTARNRYFPPKEWYHFKKNGELINVEIVSHLISYNCRPARHILIKDITDQKRAGDILRYNEEKYRAFFENCIDAILLLDPEGNISDANPSACKMFGYTVNDFSRRQIRNIMDDTDLCLPGLMAELSTKGKAKGEFIFIRKNGSRFPVELTSATFSNPDKIFKTSMIIRDITARRKTEEKLLESEQRFRTLFETNLSVMLLIDPESGYITDANESAEKFYGWTRKQLLKKRLQEINTLGEQITPQLHQTREHENIHFEFRHKLANGSIRDVEIFSSKIVIQGKYYLHSIIHDITEKKKMFEELISAKEKAEEADRLKTAFLNNISHEIRTPLSAIIGFSTFLASPELTQDKRKEFLNIIEVSNNQLMSVISGIIALSTLEAGQEKILERETDINLIMRNVYEHFIITDIPESITFNYKTSLSLDQAFVLTDPVKLMQILINLVGNALKFTHQGKVSFGCHIAGNQLTFVVEDTGIGISTEMHRQIFERFWQADISSTRSYGGIGMGLALSKGYVELLGGTIQLESTPGIGSVFIFHIPYKPVVKPGLVLKSFKKMPAHGIPAGKSILVAEDEINNYLLIRELLTSQGVKIIRAENGLEAVTICRSGVSPDLILMDIKMPVMDGAEAARQIKKINPDLPVIALTSYALDADRKSILESGCDEYIVKPFQQRVLFDILSKYLNEKK